MIGSLLYLSNKSRPDLSFSVNYCSRFVEQPKLIDINNTKRILKYPSGKLSQGLFFKKGEKLNVLNAYCDSDFAGDLYTRKSTAGYIIFLGNSPITWCSRLQPIVALSSTEAEFIAAAECVKEVLFISELLKEVINSNVEINLYMDNQSAMSLIKNGVINQRSKHICRCALPVY